MLRYRTTKQAYMIASLVILLCVVCLVGSTFALFTSNAEDGTIGIITTAGTVRVDIVDASDERVSLAGEALQFLTPFGNEDFLFEPGATFYTQGFKIKNSGDVPINFHLTVSIPTAEDMQDFREAFDVWITTEINNFDTAERLEDFKGRLNAGEATAETYYLFIKMKETANNTFQGRSYTGIGVTIFAVQGNVSVEEAESAEQAETAETTETVETVETVETEASNVETEE